MEAVEDLMWRRRICVQVEADGDSEETKDLAWLLLDAAMSASGFQVSRSIRRPSIHHIPSRVRSMLGIASRDHHHVLRWRLRNSCRRRPR